MSQDQFNNDDGELATQAAKPKLKKPPLYKVVLLNDDYTPMEFVVFVLCNIFNMSEEKAYQVMMHVHEKGVGVCGVYTRDIAETKVEQVMQLALGNEHPLQCRMEPESEGNE